ncbi:MAG: hypothetical protein ABWJ97_06065 [Thermoproteus sp.]
MFSADLFFRLVELVGGRGWVDYWDVVLVFGDSALAVLDAAEGLGLLRRLGRGTTYVLGPRGIALLESLQGAGPYRPLRRKPSLLDYL